MGHLLARLLRHLLLEGLRHLPTLLGDNGPASLGGGDLLPQDCGGMGQLQGVFQLVDQGVWLQGVTPLLPVERLRLWTYHREEDGLRGGGERMGLGCRVGGGTEEGTLRYMVGGGRAAL